MTIVRADRSQTDPWFVVSRDTAQDSQLSYRARGMLMYILSKPDGWEIQEDDLVENASEGRDAIRTALAELKDAGYLVVERRHDLDTGKFQYVKTVHERPVGAPSTENQELVNRRRKTRNGKPGTGKPSTENQELETRPLIYKRERVQSRELERESTEREAAAPPTAEPSPPSAAHTPQHSPAELAFSEAFPKAKLTPEQRTALRGTVTDLQRWRDLLALWQRNGWRPLIGNLLDRYAKEPAHEAHTARRLPTNTSPTSPAGGLPLGTPPPPGSPRPKKPWELQALWDAKDREAAAEAARIAADAA